MINRNQVVFWFVIFFSLCLNLSYGQALNVSLSPRHLTKINESRSVHQRLKKYKKFYRKDSAKYLRNLNTFYKRKYDSISRSMLHQREVARQMAKKGIAPRIDSAEMLQQYAALLQRDSSLTATLHKAQSEADQMGLNNLPGPSVYPMTAPLGDSSEVRKIRIKALEKAKEKSLASLPRGQQKQVQEIQNEFGAYSNEAKRYLVFLKDSVDHLDTLKSLAVRQITEQATRLGESQINRLTPFDKSLTELKSTPDQYKQQVEDLTDTAKMKEAAKQKLVELLQNKMSVMKSKYSTLLNSNDLSTGIKEESLKGRPLRERWVIGGNLNIVDVTPLMIDFAPQIGYRINKRFQAGVSGVYRAKFVDSVKVSNAVPSNVYGYSVFASYSLVLNFFAYAEFERTTSTTKSLVNDLKGTPIWINSALIGIGRQFKIHKKVNGSVLFLWNPLHVNGKSPYHEAFVIKTGFQLSQFALLGK